MSCRSSHRVLWAALALLSYALAARAADAQKKLEDLKPPPPSTSSVDPGTLVEWKPDDPTKPGWQSALPFDVQFYIGIPIDARVKSVDGRYVGDTSPFFCGEAFPRIRRYVDYGYGPRDLIASEQRRIQRMGGWARDPKKSSATTAVLNVVDGLLPNRHYCFEITKVRNLDADAKDFQKKLVDGVDQVLRTWNQAITEDSVRLEVYTQLRQAVIEAIQGELGENERLILPSGSFLDSTTELKDLEAKEKLGFDPIIGQQSSRAEQMKTLTRLLDQIAPSLETVFASSAVREAQERLPADDPLKPLVAWVELDPTGDELAAIGQGTIDLEGALKGRSADTPVARAEPWTEIWSPAQLAVRKENLKKTLRSLKALDKVLDGTDYQKLADAGVGTAEAVGVLKELPEKVWAHPRPVPDDDQQATEMAIKALQDAKLEAGKDPEPLRQNPAITAEAFRTLKALRGLTGTSGIGVFLAKNFTILEDKLEQRGKLIAALVQHITRVEIERLLIEGSTTADYETQSNWYLGFDLGLAWAEGIEEFFGYLGTNIYFRPVNKKAPLSWSSFRKGQRTSELLKRLSVTVGITIDDLEGKVAPVGQFQAPSQETLTQGLIGKRQLVFGAGFRLNRYLRVSAGALVFKDKDPNPLVDRSRLAWSPLLSVSVDFDITSSLGNRFKQ